MNRFIVILISMMVCFPISAKIKIYKDWAVNTEGDSYYYAATKNKSGHVFGEYCYFKNKSCLFLIGIDITCHKGHQYPVLVNSEQGALNLTLSCGNKVDHQNVLIFNNFDKIDQIVRTSSKLGVVVPMESGQFKVSRFSLLGAKYCIDTMRAKAAKHLSKNKNKDKNQDEDSEFL
ncbi:hypothetical protein [Celerinatantimonas diazotrophica]|uniref:Invasion protein IalB n=1 Tax=Celerinatantimonas diazotrophica TaxID=412034 RepID=A0A4R1K2T1_9GAMM|nr:hypothetical protein [Celerinatantimonas diazotrophica]TCK58003.1 hypothetical protein EV690_1708 [Celerinatantimonas diazotrophica]CAG9297928.1 hypothetical protein CEDIAZO_03120 [Celerinatantimonas diazotrophica]